MLLPGVKRANLASRVPVVEEARKDKDRRPEDPEQGIMR